MTHPTRIYLKPENLEKDWKAYKESLTERSKEWGQIQYVGRDGRQVTDFPRLPLTSAGFYRYVYETKGKFIEQYFTNQDEVYGEFIGICSHIKREIREDQITGGLIGQFNPSITQRLNGLTEKTEHKMDVKVEQITGMEIK